MLRRQPCDLSVHPDAGDVIAGTGIYLQDQLCDAKGVKDDLTASERAAWRKAVEVIDND